jgi:hypothetical protein
MLDRTRSEPSSEVLSMTNDTLGLEHTCSGALEVIKDLAQIL